MSKRTTKMRELKDSMTILAKRIKTEREKLTEIKKQILAIEHSVDKIVNEKDSAGKYIYSPQNVRDDERERLISTNQGYIELKRVEEQLSSTINDCEIDYKDMSMEFRIIEVELIETKLILDLE